MHYQVEPIALIQSPYKEKFATPRQPGLTPAVKASIVFHPQFATPEAVRGLEGFSHIWIIFLFHRNWNKGWTPTVRPPRLGGNQRVGVYASRSPFRPNPIGLSAVKLLAINNNKGKICLSVEGADLIDQTPVLDIKPYIPYGDSIPDALGGFAHKTPKKQLVVEFSQTAQAQLLIYQQQTPGLGEMLRETLSLDPRPAYQQKAGEQQEYGVLFDRYNVRWTVRDNCLTVLAIELAE